jgi:hypothetical protein
VQLDFASREITIKLVYYGPALSGKTTNLVALHARAGSDTRGRLMTLETQDDRTLFFDLLPLTFKSKDGDFSLRIKLFTVPGQPIHAATRKLVLQGADGVAFIADSRTAETGRTAESYLDLRKNLKDAGRHSVQQTRFAGDSDRRRAGAFGAEECRTSVSSCSDAGDWRRGNVRLFALDDVAFARSKPFAGEEIVDRWR